MKNYIIFFSLFFVSFSHVFAYTDTEIQGGYDNFVKKVEAKYPISRQYDIFQLLDERLSEYQDKVLASASEHIVDLL